LIRRNLLLAIAALAIAVSCATTAPPAPKPPGDERFLVDPRIGYAQAPENLDRRFTKAWNLSLAGDLAGARAGLADLRARTPEFLPAALGEAAIDIREGNLDPARKTVDRAIGRLPNYTAARIYEAEIAVRDHQLRRANDLYSAIVGQPGVPEVSKQRLIDVRRDLFDELVASAATAGPESTRLLREALSIDPTARAARMMLVRHLIAEKNWDEAQRALTPLSQSPGADSSEIQAALAEIEVGHGQYEQAIARYEQLARRDSNPEFATRLEQIKEDWNAANMPPQYQRALESEAITRSDFAVLLYWKLVSIRFAQNLGSPPIALDIGEVPGRDEVIRAMALGILTVDPVTRRVSPTSPVTAAAFARIASRTLLMRGAPCARTVPGNLPELQRAQAVLAACSVNDPSLTLPPDDPVSGRIAAAAIDQIENVLSR
jgi:tetratricopeptide (TPR) repeat protein